MVGAGGADANADADATSPRLGSRQAEAEAEDVDVNVDVTPSGQASNLLRRTAASLSRDGDDKLKMSSHGGLVWWVGQG
ncbi:hypothetical protein FHL15_005120 [Xylaria flabelliformis]|uniref:Uncharacterized protein n=1 Tax=Xylaria flabelliformis TaxID=2512241 RepID=A0A553I1H1_9PEZI|nr:hypothetical protein FHL15_005120 [Xylaria flabelliformis]